MNAASYQSDSRPAGPVASNSFKRGCLSHFAPALTGCRAKPPARQPGAPVPGKHHLGVILSGAKNPSEAQIFSAVSSFSRATLAIRAATAFGRSLVVEKPGAPQQITSSAGVLPLRFAQHQDDSLEILELETATVAFTCFAIIALCSTRPKTDASSPSKDSMAAAKARTWAG